MKGKYICTGHCPAGHGDSDPIAGVDVEGKSWRHSYKVGLPPPENDPKVGSETHKALDRVEERQSAAKAAEEAAKAKDEEKKKGGSKKKDEKSEAESKAPEPPADKKKEAEKDKP